MGNVQRTNDDSTRAGANETDFDIVVIGGGVNGAGIARDAAGRGLKVMLCEKDDLAHHTSSSSTKLIHGGLRYLEYYDFMLVRHALQEREVLHRMAPHIIWPLRFILPHHQNLRPRWLIRLGLFIYDHIGGREKLPPSHSVDLRRHVSGGALKDDFTHGFEYSDCWVQDSRLVTLNVMDAEERGCDVRIRTECTDMRRHDDHFEIDLHDKFDTSDTTVTAKAVVNASGPWVDQTLRLNEGQKKKHGVRLVKGSHIIVPQLFEHEYTYIFQNGDGRVLFAVPYEYDYTLLGTTDVEVSEEPGRHRISDDETQYICDAVSEYFAQDVKPDDVVASYSGVRPLYDDASDNASTVTRDYKLDMDVKGGAPILSVYGGKITTYRKLAEQAIDMLKEPMGFSGRAWTSGKVLPGGDIPGADFPKFLKDCENRYPWMDERVQYDYARNYGTRIDRIVGDAQSMGDLGRHFGGPLYQAEVDYLVRYEYARTGEDIMWRRSRKRLHTPDGTEDAVQAYLDETYAFESGMETEPMRKSA